METFNLKFAKPYDAIAVAMATSLVVVMVLRAIIESIFLLPSPVGDSVLFLHASNNFCAKGFLGTETIGIDPTGRARYVWHGFVSPYFYGSLNFGCAARGYFILNSILKFMTALLVLVVASKNDFSYAPGIALAVLVFAIQTKLQFRPESLAICILVFAEWALLSSSPIALGFTCALLLWCQPTVFSLYIVFLMIRLQTRPNRLTSSAAGFGAGFVLLALLYPFPLSDLIKGLVIQASSVANRGGGDFLIYYGMTHFLPFWFVLFLGAFVVCCRYKLWLLLWTPAIWWFGPRIPHSNYNLLALLPIVVWVAATLGGPSERRALTIGCFFVGFAGLAQGLMRDGLTAVQYQGSFRETAEKIAMDAHSSNYAIGEVPTFVFLTNPSLPLESSTRTASVRAKLLVRSKGEMIDYFSVSGMSTNPCPMQRAQPNEISMFGRVIFNSNSGYGVYRCVTKAGEN